MQSLAGAAQSAVSMVPLYQQDLEAQKAATYKAIGSDNPDMIKLRQQEYKGQQVGLIDFNKMSNTEWRNFKNALSPEQKNTLFKSDPYLNNYNPNFFQIQ